MEDHISYKGVTREWGELHLREIVLFGNHSSLSLALKSFRILRVRLCMLSGIMAAWEIVHFLPAIYHVHGTIMMVVVEGAFWSIDGQLQVVWTKAVSLRVRVAEYAGLEQLVLRVPDPRHDHGRCECNALIVIMEVVRVHIQHHASYWLQGEEVFRPGFSYIQRVEVKAVLISGIQRLDT